MEELDKGYEFTKAKIAELESLRAWKAEVEKQEPVCWMTPSGEGWMMRTEPPVTDTKLGWTAMFAAPVVSPDVEKLKVEIAELEGIRQAGYDIQDELRAENQSLKAELEAARKDSDLLDFIAGEYIKVDSFDMQTGGDDADSGWRLSQYHMGKPRERVLVEYYLDDLRAAIHAAIEQSKGAV